jgi:hypothetical protein
MRLTDKAIKAIDNKRTRTLLALELDFSERWISDLIDKNDHNSPLTTMAAIEVIRQETGLTDDKILDRTKQAVRALGRKLVL